ncbi:hypothetical protein [Mucilaginibacter sp. BT774]|uniref:hypothetical protein n=1 Tax=Mucilaginibacter sp. BT774 TaxID=3062276 RepID=UPI00267441A1|nr:hypothetical protein [Mucilaginibacter sp. BT774]MDO3626100.1 hypothetical protein [Mucilaginibacter sp. BT774]
MTIKRKDMEKSGIALLVAGMLFLAACSFGNRHTTIVEKSNDHYLRIEYAGHISFNEDGTAIRSISRDGYVEYQQDSKKLEAKNNGNGGISYELYDGYEKLGMDERGRQFIAEAVKVMMQKTHHP